MRTIYAQENTDRRELTEYKTAPAKDQYRLTTFNISKASMPINVVVTGNPISQWMQLKIKLLLLYSHTHNHGIYSS
jgi:hypothetical protein